MILVRHTAQCPFGRNMFVMEENEMEHCSATIYPPYDYAAPPNIVGVYRTLEGKHPSRDNALKCILKDRNSGSGLYRDYSGRGFKRDGLGKRV